MTQRDHGGDLGAAMQIHGGARADWIDLSTGINRHPYALPALPAHAWHDLPSASDTAACAEAARGAYDAAPAAAILPLAGAQAAIRLIPRLRAPGRVGILGPTYNEHAAAFAAAGWRVTQVSDLDHLHGFDAAVLVNPNNPDGRGFRPESVLALKTGLLILDESFGDTDPALSICPHLGRPDLIALRSLGKFFGLAGPRLGFALGAPADMDRLRDLAGPWPVSGPALAAGTLALADTAWITRTRARLTADAARLDTIAQRTAGWRALGGTPLFRLYATPDATTARAHLARARIWTRAFPYSDSWLRLGLPGPESEWTRLTAALADC